MNIIVCLTENDYWHGVCALLNSLHKNNFKGIICVGYRGEIPTWIKKLEKNGENTFKLNAEVKITLNKIEANRHFGYQKVFLLAHVVQHYSPEKIFYFDTDCIPITDFKYFEDWSENHISLCSDECYTFIHKNHPWKIYWKNILEKNNFKDYHLDYPYINSGYLGLGKAHFYLIERWKSITLYLENNGLNTSCFNKTALVPIQGDQEILNMALSTIVEKDISIIGKEGMGFQDPIYLMVHCTSKEKPWSKKFTFSFLKTGVRLSQRENIFFKHLNCPIKSMSSFNYILKKIDIKLSILLGRIF